MQFFQRILLVACTVALLGTSTAQPSLSIRTTRSSLDLLDSLGIVVSVRNPSKTPQAVRFPHSVEYAIEVTRDSQAVWTSLAQVSPAPRETTPPHERVFGPGVTTIATFDWNELTAAGTSPLPGVYTIRAHLLDRTASSDAVQTVRFVEPLPVSAIAKLRIGDEVTVAGVVDASQQTLADSTGTLPLSKRLIGATFVRLAVRGSIAARPDGSRYLAVERWAPLAPPRDQDARSRS